MSSHVDFWGRWRRRPEDTRISYCVAASSSRLATLRNTSTTTSIRQLLPLLKYSWTVHERDEYSVSRSRGFSGFKVAFSRECCHIRVELKVVLAWDRLHAAQVTSSWTSPFGTWVIPTEIASHHNIWIDKTWTHYNTIDTLTWDKWGPGPSTEGTQGFKEDS